MRRVFATLAVLGLLAPAPVLAQTVFETHAEAGPAGRSPTRVYRPLAQDSCKTARNHHQTGKIPLTPQVQADANGCRIEYARADTAERVR